MSSKLENLGFEILRENQGRPSAGGECPTTSPILGEEGRQQIDSIQGIAIGYPATVIGS